MIWMQVKLSTDRRQRWTIRKAGRGHGYSPLCTSSSGLVETKRHFPVVEESKVLAFVRHKGFEVRPHDAVPGWPVFHLEFCLSETTGNQRPVLSKRAGVT